jgi:hypothetical protein
VASSSQISLIFVGEAKPEGVSFKASKPYLKILGLKKLLGDKHSSLFCQTVGDED